jgi:hypothetical protein
MYVAHVLFLYATGLGLATLVGPVLVPHVAVAVAVFVILVNVLLALGFGWAKERLRALARPTLARPRRTG